MLRHAILIVGDDEEVRCSFAEMAGSMDHVEGLVAGMPGDILDRVASGEIDRVIFCPATPRPQPQPHKPGSNGKAKKATPTAADPANPVVFVRYRDDK